MQPTCQYRLKGSLEGRSAIESWRMSMPCSRLNSAATFTLLVQTVNRSLWIRNGLPFRRLAHKFAFIGERDHTRCKPVAFGVLNHFGLAALDDRYDRVGGAQVDANYLLTCMTLSLSFDPTAARGVEDAFISGRTRQIEPPQDCFAKDVQ
jgi:hypothetical protein